MEYSLENFNPDIEFRSDWRQVLMKIVSDRFGFNSFQTKVISLRRWWASDKSLFVLHLFGKRPRFINLKSSLESLLKVTDTHQTNVGQSVSSSAFYSAKVLTRMEAVNLARVEELLSEYKFGSRIKYKDLREQMDQLLNSRIGDFEKNYRKWLSTRFKLEEKYGKQAAKAAVDAFVHVAMQILKAERFNKTDLINAYFRGECK